MIRSWRSQIHEAEQAFAAGRLQAASHLIQQGRLQQFLPGQRLAANIVEALVQRSQRNKSHGDLSAAWSDFDFLTELEPEHRELETLRQSLTDQSLQRVDELLAAGQLEEATQVLDELRRRRISTEAIRTREEAAQRVAAAQRLSREGKFAAAERQLQTAATLSPELTTLQQQAEDCRTNRLLSNVITDQLRLALIGDDWVRSMSLAERLLQLAPDSKLAIDTCRRAAQKVKYAQPEPRTQRRQELAETAYWRPASPVLPAEGGQTCCCSTSETAVMKPSEPRFLLWVDAVGGFLVCLGNQVTIGQAVPDIEEVEIPILGDLSRQHARITRVAEDYLIDPLAAVNINGRRIDDSQVLADGDEFELGQGVVLRYRRPHALSATARLELISRHRTQPSADGVLLMAESCVLGPNWNNHVVCRDWSEDVVLFRQGEELLCRSFHGLEIDGELCEGPKQLSYNSRVSGDDFSMSLEEI